MKTLSAQARRLTRVAASPWCGFLDALDNPPAEPPWWPRARATWNWLTFVSIVAALVFVFYLIVVKG